MLDLNDFVDNADKLYSLPDLCLQLNFLVNDGKSSIDEISRLVSIDPALTVRVLKLANSALYIRKGSVTTIAEAVQIVGTDELNNIAIATSAALIFHGAGCGKINLHDYWYHSVVTAILARDIYRKSTGKRDGGMFVAGLLHNIGLLVVLERLPYYAVDLTQVIGEERLAWQYEKLTLGFSFSELGSALIFRWNISSKLSEIIEYQYSPHDSPLYSIEAMVLNCAIIIADNMLKQRGCDASETYVEQNIINSLGISYQQLDQIILNVKDVAPGVASIFCG